MARPCGSSAPSYLGWLATTTLCLLVGGCGAAPPAATEAAAPTAAAAPGSDEAPPGVVEPDILATHPDVVDRAIRALDAGDFDCGPLENEKGVGACDVHKDGVPSIVLVYGTPVLFLLSHFLRKPEVECSAVLGKVNEINGAVDRLKLVCIDNRVTFMTMVAVPSRGLDAVDLREQATWFRSSVQMVLATSGLVESLQ